MEKRGLFNGLRAGSAPLLPLEPAKLKGGRPRTSDHAALRGIVFVFSCQGVFASTLCTCVDCQKPPRAERIPRAFNS